MYQFKAWLYGLIYRLNHFNTSHVSVQAYKSISAYQYTTLFQYISCISSRKEQNFDKEISEYFNTSHVSVQASPLATLCPLSSISIHLMYQFKKNMSVIGTYLTNFNTSHVSVQEKEECIAIETLIVFQYISCISSRKIGVQIFILILYFNTSHVSVQVAKPIKKIIAKILFQYISCISSRTS